MRNLCTILFILIMLVLLNGCVGLVEPESSPRTEAHYPTTRQLYYAYLTVDSVTVEFSNSFCLESYRYTDLYSWESYWVSFNSEKKIHDGGLDCSRLNNESCNTGFKFIYEYELEGSYINPFDRENGFLLDKSIMPNAKEFDIAIHLVSDNESYLYRRFAPDNTDPGKIVVKTKDVQPKEEIVTVNGNREFRSYPEYTVLITGEAHKYDVKHDNEGNYLGSSYTQKKVPFSIEMVFPFGSFPREQFNFGYRRANYKVCL
ncbi:hypothetical protein [Flavilitoribacter nigricans]|uniref:Uncharacterized protein n=1 Tax=Flavilitoribacter nigricans (strain ATCC 23147 / DSM 23189 / NBRC 102662 / NCIMB 1420 / SS-2) TaxID=1122177 RepID=A0A2D0N076_FLAN2|nr:hypothetical protein [Flavilitoribacter nigricans]PHN01549.1 hypothetical protein CRP01_36735 [Flavilitoribacter nigricans DSM 23189 = NBRC 102662]